jgi:hypothetical protein
MGQATPFMQVPHQGSSSVVAMASRQGPPAPEIHPVVETRPPPRLARRQGSTRSDHACSPRPQFQPPASASIWPRLILDPSARFKRLLLVSLLSPKKRKKIGNRKKKGKEENPPPWRLPILLQLCRSRMLPLMATTFRSGPRCFVCAYYRADGAPPFDEAQADYTAASEQYMFDLSDYEDWAADEARAAHILLGSMKVEFAMDLTSLPSSRVMWERATELYQPKSHALYISVLELASSIRQQDSSVDAFYHQLADSLASTYCWSCDYCRLRQEHDSVLRLH